MYYSSRLPSTSPPSIQKGLTIHLQCTGNMKTNVIMVQLMVMAIVSALISGLSGLGLSPGWEHCVVFLGKTLNSHSASLHPRV